MKDIKTFFVNVLFLLLILGSFISAQNGWGQETLEQDGLNVAVYSVISNNPDYNKLVTEIRTDAQNSNGLKIVYSNKYAHAYPFYAENKGAYPFPLSKEVSPDFDINNLEITDDFIIHWRGKILIPKGYFALRLDHIDDWASVYIYKDSGDEKKLSKTVPFVTTKSIFGSLVSTDRAYTYFPQEKLVNIEIIFVQKKKNFSFNISTIMGLTKEAVYLSWGKRIEFLEPVYVEEAFIQKDGSWWQSIGNDENDSPTVFKASLFSPEKKIAEILDHRAKAAEAAKKESEHFDEDYKSELGSQIDSFVNGPDDTSETQKALDNCRFEFKEPVRRGFKGEIVKIPYTLFPIQIERQSLIDEKAKNDSPYRGAFHIDPGNYWDKECEECSYDLYMPDIINVAEERLRGDSCRIPIEGNFTRDEQTNRIVDDRLSFSTLGNNSLDFSLRLDNYAAATREIPVFRVYKKAFDLMFNEVGREEGNSSQKYNVKGIKDFEGALEKMFRAVLGQNGNIDLHEKGSEEVFRRYLGPGLFWMTLTKFSGRLELPEGFLKMSLAKSPSDAVVIFVKPQSWAPPKFKNFDDLKKEAFLYSFHNLKAPYKGSNEYKGPSCEIVNIYVYLFHYAGPISMKAGIDLDGKGYRDLSEFEEFIVE